jgi:hypothetical protein
MTWLGFRMANNVRNAPDANMVGKVFTSVFCLFVAAFMFLLHGVLDIYLRDPFLKLIGVMG